MIKRITVILPTVLLFFGLAGKICLGDFPNIRYEVAVVGSDKNSVQGLGAGSFTVQEDGTTQSAAVTGETSSASIALVLDASGSVINTELKDITGAASQFVDMLGGRTAIIKFSGGASVVRDFTSDKISLKGAISSLSPTGGATTLYDAVYKGIEALQSENGRKAVIVLTDGYDNGSSRTYQDVVNYALSKQIPIFSIALGNPYKVGLLQNLSSQTNGVYYHAFKGETLPEIFKAVAGVIQYHYFISYATNKPKKDGSVRAITTSVGHSSQSASCTLQYSAPQGPPPAAPVAQITSISPNPAVTGENITFTGAGTDTDGQITEYVWRSSIDGDIGSSSSFTRSDLSMGDHTVYFKVKDNDDMWSDEVSASLTVTEAPPDDEPPDEEPPDDEPPEPPDVIQREGYEIIQLTNNDYDDWIPQIDNGQVVWEGYDGQDFEIFLFNGNEIIQLTNNNYDDRRPQIDNGQVVWTTSNYDVLLFNGTNTITLTDYGFDPQIQNGQVVWEGLNADQHTKVFFFDGARTIQLTEDDYNEYDPSIHNGQIAWVSSYYELSYWELDTKEIVLFDGIRITRLTDNNYDDEYPKIHNGQVVWTHIYGGGRGYSDIFLFDGKNTITLTNRGYDPKIDNGQVVWDDRNNVFLFDGKSTTIIGAGMHPQIHNGQVAWGTGEIFLFNGTSTIQLTKNDYNDGYPQINNGQVVWEGNYGGGDDEIFLARPGTTPPEPEPQPNDVALSGTVRYENRIYNETGEGNPEASEYLPVRFVKVQVFDADTKTALGPQTGTNTDDDGNYSITFKPPASKKVYITCSAKGDGNYNISIGKDATNIQSVHSIDSKIEDISGDSVAINLDITEASGSGGAFNIFDQLVKGADVVNDLSGTYPPSVTVYWEKGVGGGSYFDAFDLNINGSEIDPDEYDDSVILHEYGHFLAKKYSFDKSLGGNHHSDDTNQDPRLSWSEGWANFFSSLVRRSPFYIDYGLTGTLIINCETFYYSGNINVIDLLKGQDCELNVASILWDIYDSHNEDADSLNLGAGRIWDIFENYFDASNDCVLEDFYNGWFKTYGDEYYKQDINALFASRKVFYSDASFKRGRIYRDDPVLAIPDQDDYGIISLGISIPYHMDIRNVNVFLHIRREYGLRSDLEVSLVSPSQKKVKLFEHNLPPIKYGEYETGFSQDIFGWFQEYENEPKEDLGELKGEDAYGEWKLEIRDTKNLDSKPAVLTNWRLEIKGAPSEVAVELYPGCNFISVPLLTDTYDTRITELLFSIEGRYTQISRFNPVYKSFEDYINNPGYDKFNRLEYGKGYQIWVEDPLTLTFKGKPSPATQMQLKRGWNLIGCPKLMEMPVEDALKPLALGIDYTAVHRYNPIIGYFDMYSRDIKEFDTLKPGEAYYIWCEKDIIWEVEP